MAGTNAHSRLAQHQLLGFELHQGGLAVEPEPGLALELELGLEQSRAPALLVKPRYAYWEERAGSKSVVAGQKSGCESAGPPDLRRCHSPAFAWLRSEVQPRVLEGGQVAKHDENGERDLRLAAFLPVAYGPFASAADASLPALLFARAPDCLDNLCPPSDD